VKEAPLKLEVPEKVTPKPEVKPGKRIFVYDGREFDDPDTKMTTDEVRLYYATFFPELANAEVLATVARPSKATPPVTEQVTEFKRRTGTKGA
jgi:PRTRC genetic system protein C